MKPYIMNYALINRSRKGWIDALRGLAILLVMYGHCITNMQEFFVFTSSVKMPLFFAISGYVFSANGGGKFISQLIKKVIVPWFVLGLVTAVPDLPQKGADYLYIYFLKMLSGEELWFMPCFVVAQILQYIIRKTSNSNSIILLNSFLCFVIGLIAYKYNFFNWGMVNRAFVVQLFYLIGYLFHEYEHRLVGIKWKWIILLAGIYVGFCLLSMQLYPNQNLDVHHNYYYNIPICILLIYLGVLLLFIIACKTDYNTHCMSFIGQNTLLLYLWHLPVIAVLIKALSVMRWDFPINWWTAIIEVIWAIIVCGICAIFINRYLPAVVGKRRM